MCSSVGYSLNRVRIFCAAGGLTLPETPNSLIERGYLEEGRNVLERIRGTENIQVEYEDILLVI